MHQLAYRIKSVLSLLQRLCHEVSIHLQFQPTTYAHSLHLLFFRVVIQ